MGNDDIRQDFAFRDEEQLNSLLRRLSRESVGDASWPPAELIVAYIRGGGSEKERDRVQELLASSADFRRFVLETAELIRGAEEPETAREFDEVKIPRLKKLETVIPRLTTRPDRTGWLSSFLRPRVLVPVLSTAAVLLLLVTLTRQSRDRHPIYSFTGVSEVDPALFTPVERRGVENDRLSRLGSTPKSAAINAFRQILTYNWETGVSSLDTSGIPAESNEVRYSLQIVDTTSGARTNISFGLPASATTYRSELQVWMLDVAGRTLSSTVIPGDQESIAADPIVTGPRLFTITYAEDTVFGAARAVAVYPR